MSRLGTWIGCILALFASACCTLHPKGPAGPSSTGPTGFVVDDGGRPVEQLEVGSTLTIGARGLAPGTTYEIRLGVGGQGEVALARAVSFARTTTDRAGAIDPLVLWYQSGVVGCSPRAERRLQNPYTFRSFEEAEKALAGKTLTVSIHPVERDPEGRRPPSRLRVGEAVSVLRLPVRARLSPFVYPSDASGCLVNSQETGDGDVYVSGRNFAPGTPLEIAVVPNQRAWYVGDPIDDVTGASSAAAPKRTDSDAQGRFTVKAWERGTQRRGTFDIVAHDLSNHPGLPRRIGSRDLISFGKDTALILSLLYPVGGPLMDIAGRPVPTSPYFDFADSFADTGDPVWGAVDPTFVPAGHPGGTYAAYYVVQHRDVAGWNPGMGGATNLVDVSGGIEIHPVKAGCVNGTDVIIWPAPLTVGKYDVVVDFGTNPAATPAQYVTDSNYDETVDFLDGASQVGFEVAPDPDAFGTFAIGQDSYSQDDFFATLGSRANVDLRAVVRYPATTAGAGTPVAPGAHPIFVIEHGNHTSCTTPGFDGNAAYNTLHTGCPNRKKNHEGYMGLLDRLASHGIIAVSIDAYDLTGYVPQLIPERSQLILKHLELWSHMNDTTTFATYPDFFAGRFANHVDLTKISVSGHSRGGEASVGAYMLNTNFSIGSVSSIAPVDGQSYVLPDVPYFVILPAGDGDVFDLSGQRIYDRAGSGLTPVDATTKSAIDVYGASHNFFNTVWAADGDDGYSGRADLIPAGDQQRLGEAFLLAFTRIHLLGETVYEDLLRGRLTFPSFAGRKIYAIRHEKQNRKLDDGSGTLAVTGGGATVASVNNPSVHQTQAIRVGWPTGAGTLTYTVPVGQRDLTGFEVLSFRVAQTNSAANPATGGQNFLVELVGGGKTKSTWAGTFAAIPKPYNHQYVDSFGVLQSVFQNVMTTVRIPLHSFIINNSNVTLNDVDTIRLRFLSPWQGEIYADDIEFSR